MADPFLPPRAKTAWARSGPLHTELQKAAKTPFPNMGLALVDLTLGAAYGGWNDEQQFYTGSQPKIAILLAAFRLRERARASGKSGTSRDDLFAQIEKDWKPVVEKAVAGKPADFPKLKAILTVADPANPATIDFVGGTKPWDALNKAHSKGFDSSFGFLDRLKLSIGWSDKYAKAPLYYDSLWQWYQTLNADQQGLVSDIIDAWAAPGAEQWASHLPLRRNSRASWNDQRPNICAVAWHAFCRKLRC
jgi:hypothetical protein